jgi:mono/diheme cytochrome c family protein
MSRVRRRTLFACSFLPAFVMLASAVLAQGPSVLVERTDYDMRKVVAPPALSETELEGRRLLVQRCAYCHDQGGRSAAPWLDKQRITTTGEDRFREKILKGSRTMPGWQYALSTEQVDQIMAFIKTVTPDQKPAAPPPRRP